VSLRTRLVAALVLLATAATIAIGLYSYRATGNRLLVEVDRSIDDRLRELAGRDGEIRAMDPRARGGPSASLGGPSDLVALQVIGRSGTPVRTSGPELPVGDAELSVAAGDSELARREVTVDGERYRVWTVPLAGGRGAIQAARSLAETDRLLASLRDRIVLAVVAVAAAAALVGWLIARQVTRRLVRLTATAEEVASTGRLDVPVPVQGADEAGRLGTAFNEMLTALARSKDDQHRLVQDAGHELRTPLTSLRTNIAVLRRYEHLEPAARARLLDDLDGETRELSDLVDELVELATDRREHELDETVALGELAERVAARTRRRTGRTITVLADGSAVVARPQALERAVSNLVDNATKFDETGGPIEVEVDNGRVTVRDRGPGIDPIDLPHLFERFYRALGARSRPGSGLGLSIVEAVVRGQGGSVFATNRAGGGAEIGFTLPVSSNPAPATEAAPEPHATGSNPTLTFGELSPYLAPPSCTLSTTNPSGGSPS
jgi:two-component system sensor histidine kinase MprB